MNNAQPRSLFAGLAALAVIGLTLTGCTNTGTPSSSASSAAGAQQTAKPAEGPTCSLADYKGSTINLKDAVVGFSQSEKEDNPFRIAETQSIKDEAAKVGVKKLITTNAQSTLS